MSDSGRRPPRSGDAPSADAGSISATTDAESSVVLLLQRRSSKPPSSPRREPTPAGERYHGRGQLGEGGMGEVRLCRDLLIGRDVAMKLLLPEAMMRADLRARFEREARVQGRLEHPSIVPVYDLGVGDDGVAYFTMKRVRGHTFRQIVHGLKAEDPAFARYTLRRLLGAFKQACLAVAFAHARGVVHRDLKPANVMMGDFGEVYVLDWGIAKVVSENEVGPERGDSGPSTGEVTATGALLGTPGYMSPEMVRGESDAVDGRSDVYALGAILFSLLTLSSLHEGTTSDAKLRSTLGGVEAAPSKRFPGLEIAPELEEICVTATAQRPEQRYPSALALAMVIERFLDGEYDSGRRRDLAAKHVLAARAAAERARDGTYALAARSEAIREVNRALALHPTDGDAIATMLQLIAEPPPVAPPEVSAELEAIATRERRATERAGALVYSIWILLLGVVVTMGVRSWRAWGCTLALVTLAALLSFWAARLKGRDSLAPGFLIAVVSSAAIASASFIFGPYLLVPAIAATNTLVFGLHTPRGWKRHVVLAMGLAALLGPPALEALGVVPRSMVLSATALEILPRMVDFTRTPTLLFLLLANLAAVVAPTLLIAKVRDDARATERKMLIHLWHFRQLIPEATEGESGAQPERPVTGAYA